MAEPNVYRVFGLSIRSEIPLPELGQAPAQAEPEVTIKLGAVPTSFDPDEELSLADDGACLTIDGVARYWISAGRRIVVEPAPGAPSPNIRLFLLGSAMGVLLHQRGLLPLHANAVEIDGYAFAFAGPSGAGKSTLAAAFHDRGFRVIADDVCVIRIGVEGRCHASPGIPRLRLWEEALAMTGRSSDAFELSYAGDESFRKFDVPIAHDQAGSMELPLAAVYELARGPFGIRPLEGSAAADAVFAHTYRGQYVQSAGNPAAHWGASLNLVRNTPIFELSRPWGLNRIANDLSNIVRHARDIPANCRDGMKQIGRQVV